MKRRIFSLELILALVALVGIMAVGVGQAMGEGDEDGGKIIFTKPVKAVVFDHANHLAQGLDCESCHDEIFQMETGSAEAGDDFTMASLYEGKYCGACHDGETAFASNTRCTVCHIGVKGYNKETSTGTEEKKGHE
ncbi:MAG: cytochrome c3 family protein [Proteobacteria bacterium]|nr:cytochrome c3 family protein [Pseudomonadota bacterium]MBU1687378.1 cytochrome c3 family protein [Pseudomonadota bacterium]